MSFLNLSSISAISLNKSNNTIKLSVFIIRKLYIIKIINKVLINLSQLFDKQFILYLLNNFKKIKIFLT